jgi:hypothetical protein
MPIYKKIIPGEHSIFRRGKEAFPSTRYGRQSRTRQTNFLSIDRAGENSGKESMDHV